MPTAEQMIALNTPFRYRGYVYDYETGFYYLNSRYYDPASGRFINADSTAYLGANSDFKSFNLYAYCSNNPVMYSDPNGHFFISIACVAFIAKVVVAVAIAALVCVAIEECVSTSTNNDDSAIGSSDLIFSDASITSSASKIDQFHAGEYTVYTLINPETNEVEYVGRTKDYEARMKQHQNEGSKTSKLKPGLKIDNLTYSQARGLEQIGIHTYNTIRLGKI